jgi:hypothetical protein
MRGSHLATFAEKHVATSRVGVGIAVGIGIEGMQPNRPRSPFVASTVRWFSTLRALAATLDE